MPYVVRDANGKIAAIHAEATEAASEELPLGHPDLAAFLAHDTVSDEVTQGLLASDFDMARITEDLIQTLAELGVIKFTDLPEQAQEKLRTRRVLRGKLAGLSGIIDDDVGL